MNQTAAQTGPCMLCARSYVQLDFVSVGVSMHTHMFKLTCMFQLPAGAEMDNQEGREPGSICTSVMGRGHLSERFSKIILAQAQGDWPSGKNPSEPHGC